MMPLFARLFWPLDVVYSMQKPPVGQCNADSRTGGGVCFVCLIQQQDVCSLFIPSLGSSVSLPPALSALWIMNQICASCVLWATLCCFSLEYQRQKCLVYLSHCGFLPQMSVFIDLSSFQFVLCFTRAVFVFIWWLCNRKTRLFSSLCP